MLSASASAAASFTHSMPAYATFECASVNTKNTTQYMRASVARVGVNHHHQHHLTSTSVSRPHHLRWKTTNENRSTLFEFRCREVCQSHSTTSWAHDEWTHRQKIRCLQTATSIHRGIWSVVFKQYAKLSRKENTPKFFIRVRWWSPQIGTRTVQTQRVKEKQE